MIEAVFVRRQSDVPMHKNRISKSIVTYLIIERKNVDCSAAVIVKEVSVEK